MTAITLNQPTIDKQSFSPAEVYSWDIPSDTQVFEGDIIFSSVVDRSLDQSGYLAGRRDGGNKKDILTVQYTDDGINFHDLGNLMTVEGITSYPFPSKEKDSYRLKLKLAGDVVPSKLTLIFKAG